MANNIIKDREQLRAKLQGAALIALADTKNGSSKIMVEPLEYGNYSAPYYMISCLAVVLQQGMRCISNFRSS